MALRSSRAVLALLLLLALTPVGGVAAQAPSPQVPSTQVRCPEPQAPLAFEQAYIDSSRAGGEPIIATHPDGQLLWGSHAGTTHFFGPAAPEGNIAPFVQEYEGQTYYYVSEDGGTTWDFVPRSPIETGDVTSGLPNSGFSDPEFAIDAAGNVYISEINLANVAVSKSSDGGRSYTLQNVFGLTFSDRQWMEADEEDVLYLVANTFGGGSLGDIIPGVSGSLGNRIYKSTDGGVTFSAGQDTNGGAQASSDIEVDRATGAVYQLQVTGSELQMAVFPNAREEMPPAMTIERFPIVAEFDRGTTIGPTMDLDDEGNIYVTWDEGGAGGRPAGIYYSHSTDGGRTWAEAVRVDVDPDPADEDSGPTDIWPWLAVGDDGRVAITWLENTQQTALTGATPSESAPADSGWHVMVAQTLTGLGCEGSDLAGFTVTQASAEPVHTGTVCNGGTTCQATATDRRLGDYFSVEINDQGQAVVAVSDTRQGGPVALPLAIRQTGGPLFLAQPDVPTPDTPLVPGCVAAATGEAPQGADRVSRLDESDPVRLGVAVSNGCIEQAATAVLARDDDYPDALAATALAAQLQGPVLLTPTEGLAPATAEELQRLGVAEVVLAGGTAALSAQVEEDVEALGIATRRIGGPERFSTAGLIADAVVAEGGPVDRAIVALGARPAPADPWPDALTAGVLGGTERAPVLLVEPDAIPGPTLDALTRTVPTGSAVTIAGGTGAIGQDVAVQLSERGYTVPRVAGEDRYGTAAALVERALAAGATLDVVVLAGGEAFAGPLVAGAASLTADGVMLLVHPDDLDSGSATRAFLEQRADRIGQVLLAGDESLISGQVEAQVRAILE